MVPVEGEVGREQRLDVGSPTSQWKGVQGFPQHSVLHEAPGPPTLYCRGVQGFPPLVTVRIHCPAFLGHLSLCHCLVSFPHPPSPPPTSPAAAPAPS